MESKPQVTGFKMELQFKELELTQKVRQSLVLGPNTRPRLTVNGEVMMEYPNQKAHGSLTVSHNKSVSNLLGKITLVQQMLSVRLLEEKPPRFHKLRMVEQLMSRIPIQAMKYRSQFPA
jgi:hypothetical protein